MRCGTPTWRSAPRPSSRRRRRDLVDLDVDDPGVLHDIDEPDDYARVFDQPI